MKTKFGNEKDERNVSTCLCHQLQISHNTRLTWGDGFISRISLQVNLITWWLTVIWFSDLDWHYLGCYGFWWTPIIYIHILISFIYTLSYFSYAYIYIYHIYIYPISIHSTVVSLGIHHVHRNYRNWISTANRINRTLLPHPTSPPNDPTLHKLPKTSIFGQSNLYLCRCLSLSIHLLHLSFYPCIYLSACLLVRLSVHQSVYLSIYLSVYLSVLSVNLYLAIHPSISIYIYIYLSISISISKSISKSILSIYLSIYLPTYLSIYLHLHLYHIYFYFYFYVSISISIPIYLYLYLYLYIYLHVNLNIYVYLYP